MPTSWRLDQWNRHYTPEGYQGITPDKAIEAKEWLQRHNCPIPEDCPGHLCPKWRPACMLNVCQIAADMCGDF